MRLVRIIAEQKDGTLNSANKFILLCVIDNENRIIKGEWFGYVKDGSIIYPFVLRSNKLLYGDDEGYCEHINLSSKNINIGSLFSIKSEPGDNEEWECCYEIRSVYDYKLVK
ncbi:hypothetical protein D6779_03685 [Candidatus Parcubacteria bacterium]|nr:MAG: hypothetical protein D6779_03685 [Candidatus Parcubacteria bacterium]